MPKPPHPATVPEQDKLAAQLEVVVTYLQMLRPPPPATSPHLNEKLALLKLERPPVHYDRYLYPTVGTPWLWHERRAMSDPALLETIHHEAVEVFVLYVGGCPGGYIELDARRQPDVEVAYFGLLPEFIGRRLGPWLLAKGVEQAWSRGPERVWLHTCSLDHPRALSVYQRAGFEPYSQERVTIANPRLSGLFD